MKPNSKKLAGAVAVLALVGAGVVAWHFGIARQGPTESDLEREFRQMPPHDGELGEMKDMKLPFDKVPADGARGRKVAKDDEDEPRVLTEQEKAEAAEEKLVESFDQLTDSWMEGSGKAAPTLKDIDAFAEQFRKVPDSRKDECIHRALNLIPDENVMLLAGILMDKMQDSAIVKTIYNDVLNRDEEVKKPILEQIFKDKTHPCWADTAWIFDVTGKKSDTAGKPSADD